MRVLQIIDSFGFSEGAKVLLFVGRMIPYKNPLFVIDVLHRLCELGHDFAAVFAGIGPLEEQVRERARQTGLDEKVSVLGWRDDVPQLMHACDVLVWPGIEEPKEGLGLGVVEAQAVGLRVIMSRNVPAEAVVIPPLVKMLSLSAGSAAGLTPSSRYCNVAFQRKLNLSRWWKHFPSVSRDARMLS